MPEIDDLRSFVEVAESGGFSRAATRLGVSKSIVSRRVARLEEELGVQLLSRTTRGVGATEAGLEFKARAERILADLEDARDAVAQHGNGLSGRLRVAAPMTFGVCQLAPLLSDLAAQHPGLEIDVSYDDRLVDLIAEGIDVAFRIGDLKDSSLVARRLAPVRAAVVASPDYLARHGTPEAPEDVARHQCLIYTAATSSEWRFHNGRRWVSCHPRGRLRADNGDVILRWAIEGLGLAAMPTFISGNAIREGRLVPVLTAFAMPEYGLSAVRPPGPHVPRKVRVLIDAAAERFGRDLSWDPCHEPAARS